VRVPAALAAVGFALLAGAVTGCGVDTGVRDAGPVPVAKASLHTERLFFIRPGGRVGAARDLVPVTVQVRAFPDELDAAVLQALERGPSRDLAAAGYRTALTCCSSLAHSGRNAVVVTGIRGGWLAGRQGGAAAPWIIVAGAEQIQQTLHGVGSTRSVVTDGLSRNAVGAELNGGNDLGATRPRRTGSCTLAQGQGGIDIDVQRPSQTETPVVVRVRTPQAVAIEFSLVDETGPTSLVVATAAQCGVFAVPFPGPAIHSDVLSGRMNFQVRVTPLAGPPNTGVTRGFTLTAPVAGG
jgi:hypothetical protein